MDASDHRRWSVGCGLQRDRVRGLRGVKVAAAAEPRIVTAGRLPVMELSWVPHALIGPTAWRSDQIAACLPEREHEYVHRRRRRWRAPLPARGLGEGARQAEPDRPDAACLVPLHAGGMEHAPILVQRISPAGGRRVVIRIRGVDTVLGVAFSDADLIEFLRRIEIPDPDELVLGDSEVIAWQGGRPHQYE
ncbi:hypothetical protein GCM10010336_69280 [Streptomyces goshikiensis]|nr:hypothetical protein GCM10010336_69280 [Streptomyces goshikiensis]